MFIKAFASKALPNGSAYFVDGYGGAALWLPPNVLPNEEELLAILRSTISEQRLETAFMLFEEMGTSHPKSPSHKVRNPRSSRDFVVHAPRGPQGAGWWRGGRGETTTATRLAGAVADPDELWELIRVTLPAMELRPRPAGE